MNTGFVMGTSATLFNLLILKAVASNGTVSSFLGPFLQSIIGKDDDIATYPNPFQGLNVGTYADSVQLDIDLVDGGEDNENVPLWPLIHPERQVDVILSLDASADTSYSWPNGRSDPISGRNFVFHLIPLAALSCRRVTG
jgi:lysophospholipase